MFETHNSADHLLQYEVKEKVARGDGDMKQHAEKEILETTPLCDRKGNLNPEAIGFARKPLIDCNLSGHFMRKRNGIIGAYTGKIFYFLQQSVILIMLLFASSTSSNMKHCAILKNNYYSFRYKGENAYPSIGNSKI